MLVIEFSILCQICIFDSLKIKTFDWYSCRNTKNLFVPGKGWGSLNSIWYIAMTRNYQCLIHINFLSTGVSVYNFFVLNHMKFEIKVTVKFRCSEKAHKNLKKDIPLCFDFTK